MIWIAAIKVLGNLGRQSIRLASFFIKMSASKGEYLLFSAHFDTRYSETQKRPHPQKDKVAVVACMNKTVKYLLTIVKASHMSDYSYHGFEIQEG